MTTETRFPEIERQFSIAGCKGLLAVHAASNINTQLGEEQVCGESMFLNSANPDRQSEFICGRVLAQRCLMSLGQAPTPIGIGVDREPLWPDCIVGSITHAGVFAAAVAWSPSGCQQAAGIGIDAEYFDRLDPRMWPTVFTAPEIARLNQESPENKKVLATCMFSAKEAVYKSQFPLTRRFIEYDEISVWLRKAEAFGYRHGLLGIEHEISELGPFHFSIFYYCLGDLVITGAVAVPKPA